MSGSPLLPKSIPPAGAAAETGLTSVGAGASFFGSGTETEGAGSAALVSFSDTAGAVFNAPAGAAAGVFASTFWAGLSGFFSSAWTATGAPPATGKTALKAASVGGWQDWSSQAW